MVILREFSPGNAPLLQEAGYPDESTEKIEALIAQWNTHSFDDRYFEMLGIWDGENLVGCISLYQHTGEVISIGPEIFPAHRRKGYGRQALALACQRGRELGYKIVCQQIRTDNIASLTLHASLGFVGSGQIFTNARGNPVLICLKSLV